MKDNFKIALIVLAIVAMLVLSIPLGLKFYSPNLSQFGGKEPRITVWRYQGHDMLRYEYKGSCSVCHSPACRKCWNQFD